MEDSVWLYNVPAYYDSVKWSEDNLLAVAGGHTVVVLSPAHLQGPRSHLSTRTPEIDALTAGCIPSNYDESLHLSLACLGEIQSQEFGAKNSVQAVAWSPIGCTPQGGCLLACVTSDFKVRIFGATPGTAAVTWQQVADLSAELKAQLVASKWQDARALVQGHGPQGSDALRLRGGGLPDSALQQLLRLRGGAGDAGAKAGTPGKAGISAEAAAIAAEAAAAAAAGAEVADGGAPGSSSKQAVKRPRKSAEEKAAAAAAAAAAGKHKFKVGEAVEVMNNEEGLMGCWFQAKLLQLHGQLALVEYAELAANDEGSEKLREWFLMPALPQALEALPPLEGGYAVHNDPRFRLRPAMPPRVKNQVKVTNAGQLVDVLQDDGWWETYVASATGEGRKLQLTVKVGPEEIVANAKQLRPSAAWDPITDSWSLLAAAGVAQGAAQQEAAPAASAAAAAPAPDPAAAAPAAGPSASKAPKPSPRKPPRQPKAASQATPSQPGPSQAGSQQQSGGAPTSSAQRAGRLGRRPSYTDLLDSDDGDSKEPLSPPSKRRRQASSSKGTAKRRRSAGGDGDSSGSDFRAEVEGDSSETIDDEDLASEHSDGAAAADEGLEDVLPEPKKGRGSGGKAKKVPKAKPPEYTVPEDLAPGVFSDALPHPPLDTLALLKSWAPKMMLARFMALREELPVKPTYDKGEHMKEADEALYVRVLAEFKALYNGQMELHGLTEKQLVTASKAAIRKGCIQALHYKKPRKSSAGAAKPLALMPGLPGTASAGDGTAPPSPAAARSPAAANQPTMLPLASSFGVAYEHCSTALVAAMSADHPCKPAPARAPNKDKPYSMGITADRGGGPSLCVEWNDISERARLKDISGSKMAVAQGGFAAEVDYITRLNLQAALCCGWSPQLWQEGSDGDVKARTLLAVGTKAGAVVLWQYKLPGAYDLKAPLDGLSSLKRMPLMHVHKDAVVHVSWVKLPAGGLPVSGAAARGSDLAVMLTASSMGEMKLWGATAAEVAAGQQPKYLGTVCSSAGGTTVTCCTVAVVPEQAVGLGEAAAAAGGSSSSDRGRYRLMVAAGQTSGTLYVWRSGSMGSGQELQQALQGAEHWTARQVHGTSTVTGLSINPLTHHVTSCALNGSLINSAPPAPGAPGDLSKLAPPRRACPGTPSRLPRAWRDAVLAQRPALGLARSPGGLFTALVRSLALDNSELVDVKMSHMRVAQGLVQLHTDCAPEGAVNLPAVMTPLLRQLGSRPPSAPGLWEVAAAVCRAGFANVQVSQEQLDAAAAANGRAIAQQEEDAEERPVARASGSGAPALAPGRIVMPAQLKALKRKAEVEEVLRQLLAAVEPLEQRFTAALAAAGNAGEGGPYAGMPADSWWALQAATVLRAVVAAYVRGVLANVPDAPRYEQLEAAEHGVDVNRMALVQRHIWQSLSGGSPGYLLAQPPAAEEASTTLLLMSDWVSVNVRHPELRADEILPLVAETYVKLGGMPVVNTEPPGRDKVPAFDEPVGLVSGARPMEAVRVAKGKLGGQQVEVALCGATLRVCGVAGNWSCTVCGQQYRSPPCRQYDGRKSVPYCLYCGVRLAPASGPMQVVVPAVVVPPPPLDPLEVS